MIMLCWKHCHAAVSEWHALPTNSCFQPEKVLQRHRVPSFCWKDKRSALRSFTTGLLVRGSVAPVGPGSRCLMNNSAPSQRKKVCGFGSHRSSICSLGDHVVFHSRLIPLRSLTVTQLLQLQRLATVFFYYYCESVAAGWRTRTILPLCPPLTSVFTTQSNQCGDSTTHCKHAHNSRRSLKC